MLRDLLEIELFPLEDKSFFGCDEESAVTVAVFPDGTAVIAKNEELGVIMVSVLSEVLATGVLVSLVPASILVKLLAVLLPEPDDRVYQKQTYRNGVQIVV